MIDAGWQTIRQAVRGLALGVLLPMGQFVLASAEQVMAQGLDPSGVTDVVYLDAPDLKESSGLAVSNRTPLHFWSHNDSGGEARLYAFDREGHSSGHLKFKSVEMNDWEDMAAYLEQGVPRLLVADSGDNDAKRSQIRLYLFDEPDPRAKTTLGERDFQTIQVTYPDGPRDCEAVAVDVARGLIILVSKGRLPLCGVYTIPLPGRDRGDLHVTASRLISLPIPMVTAMDIDPINGDLWVVSYFQTFCFRSADRSMSLRRQFVALPDSYDLPRWRQIEAVSIDRSHNVWVTSEGEDAPLGRLSPAALAGQKRR